MVNSDIRHSVNTGTFYPIDEGELIETVESALSSYVVPEDVVGKKVKAVLAPFIPYSNSESLYAAIYSVFALGQVDEIFIFSDPSLHQLDFVSFAGHREWETPLGRMRTTHRLENIVMSDDAMKDLLKIDNSKHQGEMSIECQLPYMQVALGGETKIIPFMVGETSPRLVTKYLSSFIDQDDLLVCVSNISSGIPTDYAEDADEVVIKAILNLDMNYLENHASTLTAPNSVSLLCNIAKHNEWVPKLLDYSMVNVSGHMGDSNVGAAAILFLEE